MDNEMMKLIFELQNSYGEITRLEKYIPVDYLGNTELGAVNECYKEFLHACSFVINSDDKVIISKKKQTQW